MFVSDAISDARRPDGLGSEICQGLDRIFLTTVAPDSAVVKRVFRSAIDDPDGYFGPAKTCPQAAKKPGFMVARMTDQPLLYSIPDAAKRLSVSRSTIYRLIDDGALLTISVRSRQRVTAKSLAKYVEHGERSRRLTGVRS